MKVLVIGSTGGSGRAAVRELLRAGHEVTAFTRSAEDGFEGHARLRVVRGDAMQAGDVERAVAGQEAVVVTLGIRENPLRVRLFGAAHTPGDVRSVGTRNVIAAMRRRGVKKLVVQTSYGVGSTRGGLRFVDRLLFALLLKPQMADTERQNDEVASSGLDWVLVQPVHLTDAQEPAGTFLSTSGATGRNQISRGSVGRFLAEAVANPEFVHQTVSLSGAAA